MAIFPCSRCGVRYSGKQNTAYPAIVAGNRVVREKARLCTTCYVNLIDFLGQNAATADIAPFDGGCTVCGADQAFARFFVTLYESGHAREDWYGISCSECLDQELRLTFWPPGAPAAVTGSIRDHLAGWDGPELR